MVGISTDDLATLAKFQKDEDAPQRFVSDQDGAIARAFGVAMVYKGKTYADRVTFIIGKGGKILHTIEDDVPQSNVASALDWAQAHPMSKQGT